MPFNKEQRDAFSLKVRKALLEKIKDQSNLSVGTETADKILRNIKSTLYTLNDLMGLNFLDELTAENIGDELVNRLFAEYQNESKKYQDESKNWAQKGSAPEFNLATQTPEAQMPSYEAPQNSAFSSPKLYETAILQAAARATQVQLGVEEVDLPQTSFALMEKFDDPGYPNKSFAYQAFAAPFREYITGKGKMGEVKGKAKDNINARMNRLNDEPHLKQLQDSLKILQQEYAKVLTARMLELKGSKSGRFFAKLGTGSHNFQDRLSNSVSRIQRAIEAEIRIRSDGNPDSEGDKTIVDLNQLYTAASNMQQVIEADKDNKLSDRYKKTYDDVSQERGAEFSEVGTMQISGP